jgi:hypothetical protein
MNKKELNSVYVNGISFNSNCDKQNTLILEDAFMY